MGRGTRCGVALATLAAVGSATDLDASFGRAPHVRIGGLGALRGVQVPAPSGPIALFKGIPYAEPPLGDLRWRPPRPFGGWRGVRDATEYGASCFGGGLFDFDVPLLGGKQPTVSEDCLFLNVAAPRATLGKTEARLPVMVWIHGGSFVGGRSQDHPVEEIAALADGSLVVISVNYRVGAWGFLASEALKSRSPDGSVGNYGIQDQRLALQWVRDHVAAFGGDASQVTIFGQSAGGFSVLAHLVQPASFGLYARAIVQSGAVELSRASSAGHEEAYQAVLRACNCGDFSCLATRDYRCLLLGTVGAESSGHGFGPTADGVAMNGTVFELLKAGQFNKFVPVILGSNSEEWALWTRGVLPNMTDAELDATLKVNLGGASQEVVDKVKQIYTSPSYPYPADLGRFSKQWWVNTRVETDSIIGACTTRRVARWLTATAGRQPSVYVYLFEAPPQAGPEMISEPGNVLCPHDSENAFVFQDRLWLSSKPEDGELELAKTLGSYWVSFATSGVPASAGRPAWPVYASERDQLLAFNTASRGGVRVLAKVRSDACDFWDGFHGDKLAGPSSLPIFA